ncbi:MAG: histidine phosphatase family protein [Rhodobacteraceae bacterium]|nr:histidine phosphatase family protein [Paracoccaceae bacterium]
MTLRLILLRHAKSSWDDHIDEDHDRVLNDRGRRSCDAIGPWLAGHGYVPDEVLCSTSLRTRETWDRLSAHLPGTPQPTLLSELYLADTHTLFNVLSEAAGKCVALIAHNPGIGSFAARLLNARPAHPQFGRFPTLATLVADFDLPAWSDLAPHMGHARDFIVPRELID